MKVWPIVRLSKQNKKLSSCSCSVLQLCLSYCFDIPQLLREVAEAVPKQKNICTVSPTSDTPKATQTSSTQRRKEQHETDHKTFTKTSQHWVLQE